MAAQSPLTGVVLVDCAKANAKNGLETAANQCGYGTDVQAFQAALKKACEEIGVEASSLSDLIDENHQSWSTQIGYEAIHDTSTQI